LYSSVVERFAKGVEIFTSTCPGLVEQIEAGDLAGPRTREILEKALAPMLAAGIDTIVMGCTHYPFVIPLIQAIAGPEVLVIDPAPAIARQARRLLETNGMLNPGDSPGALQFYTSGDHEGMGGLLPLLLDESGPVTQVIWQPDQTLQLS